MAKNHYCLYPCSFYAQIGSPNKVKTNPFPLGDGFAFVFMLKK